MIVEGVVEAVVEVVVVDHAGQRRPPLRAPVRAAVVRSCLDFNPFQAIPLSSVFSVFFPVSDFVRWTRTSIHIASRF